MTEELLEEGIKEKIAKTILPILATAGLITGGAKYMNDVSGKYIAAVNQIDDVDYKSGVYSFNYKNKNYKFNEKENTVTIDGKTKKLSGANKAVSKQLKYTSDKYGSIRESYFPY